MGIEPLADKWRAFGWEVWEIDGHDMGQIVDALEALPFNALKPSALIAHTVKGKGVSFAEDTYVWHSNTVNDEIYARALGGAVAELLAVEHPTRMRLVGMPDDFAVVGPTGPLRAKYGMSAEAIAEACRDLVLSLKG